MEIVGSETRSQKITCSFRNSLSSILSISFRLKEGLSGHPEIWLMDAEGEHARKVIKGIVAASNWGLGTSTCVICGTRTRNPSVSKKKIVCLSSQKRDRALAARLT